MGEGYTCGFPSQPQNDTPKIRDAQRKATDFHPEDYQGAQELYDNWAASYDDTLRGWGYDAHEKCTELVAAGLDVAMLLESLVLVVPIV